MPSLASGCRRRCALAVHIGRLYRSGHRARRDRSSRDALVVRSWFLMPFFGVRPPPLLCSRRPHRTFVPRSRHRTSRDALEALMVLDALFGVGPPPSLCSRRPHRTFTYRSRHRARRSYKSRRALIALPGSRCPSLSSDRRHCCGLAVHTGRLQYRSCHRAGRSVKSRRAVCAHGRSVKSRRARCALMVLEALFGIRPPPPLSSHRPHRTFVYRSRHRAEQSFKSRRAHCALMVLDAPFGVGPPRRRCALAVHIGRLYTALAIAQGDRQVETRSMRSWFSMPSFASDPPSLSSLAVHL